VTHRILAVDGGGSKTDAVLLDTDGHVLAQAKGGGSQPQIIGLPMALAVLDEVIEQLRRAAGVAAGEPIADHAGVYLSGLDLPQEIAAIEPFLRDRRWADTLAIDNDTFALLRAGTEAVDAVAVVCGTGINCVGRNAAGEQSRFPALGELTGDWGGGHHLGVKALWHAARADDGRGPRTALQAVVAAHFDRPDATSVAVAIHFGELDNSRLSELVPGILATAAAGDAVAGRLVDRLADEMALMAEVSMQRLELLHRPVDLVLGGGVTRSRDRHLLERLGKHVLGTNPDTSIRIVDAAPVVGAALLGLDTFGAARRVEERVRTALAR
jgi:N-acetylglucosamine kinase-like BadF-type ATPase